MSIPWKERLATVRQIFTSPANEDAPIEETPEPPTEVARQDENSDQPVAAATLEVETTDGIWSDYLGSVGRAPKRLFQGTSVWNDIKQVVRSNDRIYGPRVGETEQRADDDGQDENDDKDDVAVFLDEFTLFFQSHLYGDSQFLNRTGITAEEIERRIGHGVPGAKVAASSLTANEETTLALPAGVEILPEAVCIENRTGQRITGCRLVVNGRCRRDLDAITRTLLGPETDPSRLAPEALAHALLWAFRAAVIHGPKQLDRKKDPLARHPVAFFNYFGQSTCGVLAFNFVVLCAHLGLEARVRKNASHTYAELFLDDAWRIMDPDPVAEPFYPALDDPRRLVGAEDLWGSDGPIHERVKLPSLAGRGEVESGHSGRKRKRTAAFRSRERSKVIASGAEILDEVHAQEPVDTAMSLLPGERVILGYEKGGPWYTATLPISLPPKSRSVMIREFDVLDGPDLSPFVHEDMTIVERGAGRRVLVSESDRGRLVIGLDRAFPILDAAIELRTARPDASGIQLDFIQGDATTPHVPPVAVSGDGTRHFRLRRLLLRASPREDVAIALTVPLGVEIESMRVLLTCQIAGGALPVFGPGANTALLDASTPAGAEDAVDLRVHYRIGDAPSGNAPSGNAPSGNAPSGNAPPGHAPPGEFTIEAVHPPPNGVVDAALPHFSWRIAGAHDEGRAGPYRVVVAHDAEMRYVVASNFDREVRVPRLVLDDDDRSFLESGRTYYWRVLRPGAVTKPAPFSFRVE